jgi:branched-chain amino acid transport system substrate-binding protein
MVLLAACGTAHTGAGSAGSTTGDSGPLASCKGTVTVASDFPISGSDASDGVPTANGAKLAVDQANMKGAFGGCALRYTPLDDASLALGKHDPQKGAQNISALVGSAAVGVVGPFNSSVAKAEMPIANAAGLVLISPSNTNPGLTIPKTDPDIDTASLRPTGRVTYFRTCSTDIGQGRGFATSALGKLHTRTAYVMDDQETYGKGLADQFVRFYEQGGGKVAKRVGVPGATHDFKAVLTEAKYLNADLVFFGGTTSNGGGIIRKEMVELNLNARYEGGAVTDDEFFSQAGPAGDGAYGGFAAPDVTKLPSAAKFTSDYRAAFNADPGVYSANAYDAMDIILAAARKVIIDNGGKLPPDSTTFRSLVRDAVARTDHNGAIGHTTFDAVGDTTNLLFTLEVARNQKWVYDSTVQLTTSP